MITLASTIKQNIRSPIKLIKGIWNFNYTEFRLIFEQSDEMHYIQIGSKIQNTLAKSFILSIFLVITLIAVFSIYTITSVIRYNALESRTAQVEKKRAQVVQALAELSQTTLHSSPNLSQDKLLEMVENFKVREKNTKLLVQYASAELESSNKILRYALNEAGLSRKEYDKLGMQNSLNRRGQGGPSNEIQMSTADNDALAEYQKKMTEHEDLKNAINSLPSKPPVSQALITSKFGPRIHPLTGKLTIHEGIDYSPSFDQNAKAVLPGVVESITYDPKGYGEMVLIDHLNGVKTLYGHLAKVSVRQGQRLNGGDIVGKIGSTGLSTGKHLHFEILYNDNRLNPSIIMAMAKYV